MQDYFDWEFYVNYYEDLKPAGIKNEKQALKHWVTCGKKEGRLCCQIPEYFDWEFYKQTYKDVDCPNEIKAFEHWITHGRNEGRICKRIEMNNVDNLKEESLEVNKKNEKFMNVIDKYLLKTYVINLKKDTLRLEKFKQRFDGFNFEIFTGIDGKLEDELYNTWKNKFNYCLDFDWKYYIKHNEGLQCLKNEKDAIDHYNKYGKAELRLINKTCDIVNRGQWGCLQSHIYLLKKITEENRLKEDYRVLILEDDAVPQYNFSQKLSNVLENKKFDNIPLIYLGATQANLENIEILKSKGIQYYKGLDSYTSFGYILNKEGVETILELIVKEQKPYDVYLTNFQLKNETIVLYPNIVKMDLEQQSNIYPENYDKNLYKLYKW